MEKQEIHLKRYGRRGSFKGVEGKEEKENLKPPLYLHPWMLEYECLILQFCPPFTICEREASSDNQICASLSKDIATFLIYLSTPMGFDMNSLLSCLNAKILLTFHDMSDREVTAVRAKKSEMS